MILLVDMGENTTTYLRMLDIYWLFKNHITKNKNKKPNWQDGAICSKIANGPRLPPRGSLPLTDGRL